MKITKTDFNMKINVSSSWIVYITKTHEEANVIHNICLTQKQLHTDGWYYTVSTNKVCKDCRVPSFFHDTDYYVTVVEHNNGDWSKPQSYVLYIVE